MSNIRKVVYKESQGAEDLFWCRATNRIYIRQPTNDKSKVVWLTSSKWTGGYEASCPMREGLTMRVVDRAGNILFEEKIEKLNDAGDTYARKNGDFASEAIQRLAAEFGDSLSSHKEWRSWLLADKEKYRCADYDDNWLYSMSVVENLRIIGTRFFLGKKAYLAEQKCRHEVSDKKWCEYLVLAEDKLPVYALAGYKLE